MRFRPLLRALGLLLVGEAAMMLPALVVAILSRGGDAPAFAWSALIALAAGGALVLITRGKSSGMYAREGFVLVGAGWILMSLFGALPFVFSGAIPRPVDAFFETVSGFTTTGSTVLARVEDMPRGILFWRSFTQWVGGMGVLVLTIALLPQLGLKNMEVMRAESPGPSPEKLVPRVRQTAKTLYAIYLGMSAALFLLLLAVRVPAFDALLSTFAVAGTGGFSVLSASIGGYNNPAAELVIGIFMLLFGVNFAVYFGLLMRQFKRALASQELILYAVITASAIALIALNIFPRYQSVAVSLRYAAFQVSSVVTTTGYSTLDYSAWPTLSRAVLFFLMILGACAGSTSGGIKVVRLLLAFKALRREMAGIVHPRMVRAVSMDGRPVDDAALRSVLVFLFGTALVAAAALLVVSLDGFDFATTFSAVIAALSNVGVGFDAVGPSGNYAAFSDVGKLALSLCMLAGRLEIMPLLLLFTPSVWRGR